MANLFEQAKQALQMRKEVKRIQNEIESLVVTYANGGIEATMKGDFTLTNLTFTPEALEEVKAGKTERFATMLKGVMNGGIKQAKTASQQRMQQVAKEGGFPGLFG